MKSSMKLESVIFVTCFILKSSCLLSPAFYQLNKIIASHLYSSKSNPSMSAATQSSISNGQPPALILNDLTCSHDGGATFQLDKVSYILPRFGKVGLVGRNGCGKSTLLRILQKECCVAGAGDYTNAPGFDFMYEGSIEKGKEINVVSMVEQEPPSPSDITVADALLGVLLKDSPLSMPSSESSVFDTVRQYRIATLNPESTPLAVLEAVTNKMNVQNGWEILTKSEEIATRFRIYDLLSQPLSQLSGGQRKRVALAASILQDPQVLLLDEPTNHLDLLGLQYLTSYILEKGKAMTLLMVTHDRAFLDQICDTIIELDQGVLYPYPALSQQGGSALGGYASYLQGKQERLARQDAVYQSMKNKYKGELDWMRRQPQARASKSKSRIDTFHNLESSMKPNQRDATLVLQNSGRRIGNQILQVKDASLAFGEQIMLDDFSYDFKKGDRIGIVGANGVGKSTFLKILIGEQPINKGIVNIGETVVFGVYDQIGLLSIVTEEKSNLKVLDFMMEEVVSYEGSDNADAPQTARNLLTQFEFPKAKWQDRISTLSGGEKRRLQLLSVITKRPNFLILDEPTNDIDLDTLTALESYLNEFDGVLVIVSHDRFFTDKVTDHLFVFDGNGIVRDYFGSLSDYADCLSYQEESDKHTNDAMNNNKISYKEDKEKRVQKRNQISKAKKETTTIEKSIEKLKVKLKSLQEEMDNSGNSEDGWTILAELNDKIQNAQDDIDKKEMRWLELAEFLEEEDV